MIVSKINFTAKKNEGCSLQAFIENIAPIFGVNTLCEEISVFQTGKDTVTSLAVYATQKSANASISRLYKLFQAIAPKLKFLPMREYVSMAEFKKYSNESLLFHQNFSTPNLEYELQT